MHSGLVDPDLPLSELSPAELDTLLNARGLRLPNPDPEYPKSGRFDGIVPRLRDSYLRKKRSRLTGAEASELARVVTRRVCPECNGTRLNRAARTSCIGGMSIADWSALPVSRLREVVANVQSPSVAPLLTAILARLDAIDTVGLGYLSLGRDSGSLSGGEAQRIKIVRHLASALSDVSYVFDEPSAGLHPHDGHRLVELLAKLRDAHNTVLVVEHHPSVVGAADHVIDLGPGGGVHGSRIQYEGPPAGLAATETETGRVLGTPVRVRTQVRRARGAVTIKNARTHNLRDITIDVPLGVLTAATEVAGSGKSTLMALELPRQHPSFVVVDQAPLRGGVRSTPVTVLGIAERIRNTFSAATGLHASWFSANGRGACPICKGKGFLVTDLAFLDDVQTACDGCGGTRFTETTLAATFHGHTIADLLAMCAGEALDLLSGDSGIADRLHWLERVGLGYLAIGQSLDTLSGGERQRLLLARHLGEVHDMGSVRIVLDEPTAGLHGKDVDLLLRLFDELIDGGATIVVVEHNLRVVAHADHIIDIGPGAGYKGGLVVDQGSPEALVRSSTSPTGHYLDLVSG